MIITKELEIKVASNKINYYKSLGYDVKWGDIITIPIEHLSNGSGKIVKVQCDYCKDILETKYTNYNLNIKNNGLFRCMKCALKYNNQKSKENSFMITKCDYCGKEKKVKKRIYKQSIKEYPYKYCCCPKCRAQKYKEICLDKYGVDNIIKLSKTHDKIKETNLERYGVKSYAQTDECQEKRKETCIEKYGVDSYTKTQEFQDRYKETCLERYGVENSSQNKEIFDKQQKTRMEIKYYNDTDIYYQGSYEYDFLLRYYKKIKIENGKTIIYKYGKKDKTYFSDFYLPDYNLVVEIKSSFMYERNKKMCESKKIGTIENGYNYIMIMNKDYDEFEKFLNKKINYIFY